MSTMGPARNTRAQKLERQGCLFLKLPAELRNEIYRMVLVQEQTIVVKLHGKFPSDPPLLCTCKQIRSEASSIYGENHLEMSLYNLDITQVTRWMRLSPPRVALYENSSMFLCIATNQGKGVLHDDDCWSNLLTWVDLYCQGRCRRIVNSSTEVDAVDKERRPSAWVVLAVETFDLVDKLLQKNYMTMGKIIEAVKAHRGASLLRLNNRRIISTNIQGSRKRF